MLIEDLAQLDISFCFGGCYLSDRKKNALLEKIVQGLFWVGFN
jgi:hypothetical protein